MQRVETASLHRLPGRLHADAVATGAAVILALLGLGLRVRLLLTYQDNFDEGVYWASLRSLAGGHTIFSEVFSSQPPLFLLGLLPGFKLLGGMLLSARAVVLALSLAGLAGIWFAATSIAGRRAGWTAVLLLASSARYLALSTTVTAEVPAIALELLAVALAVAATRSAGRRQLVLAAISGAAVAAGTLTKLFVVVAAVPALLYLLAAVRGRPLGAASRLIGSFVAGALLVIAGVLAPLWDRRDVLYQQVIGFHLDAAAPGSGPLANLRILALSVQAPLYLLALIVLALLVHRRRTEVVPPLLWGVASLAFLVCLQPLFRHHDVLLAPPAALLAALAPLASDRTGQANGGRGRHGLGGSAIAMAVVAVMAVGTITTLYRVRQPSEHRAVNQLMATELRAATRAGDLVVSDEPYVVAMAGRQVPPPLVDTSFVRLRSGSLQEGDIEATILASGTRAVLFTGGRFEKLPGLRRWVNDHFRLARGFGDGRALYLR